MYNMAGGLVWIIIFYNLQGFTTGTYDIKV